MGFLGFVIYGAEVEGNGVFVMWDDAPSSTIEKNIFTYDQFEISISNDGSNGLPSSTPLISLYTYMQLLEDSLSYDTGSAQTQRDTHRHSTHMNAIRRVKKEQSFQKPQQQTNNLIQLICQATPANRLWNQQIIYRYNKSRRGRKNKCKLLTRD